MHSHTHATEELLHKISRLNHLPLMHETAIADYSIRFSAAPYKPIGNGSALVSTELTVGALHLAGLAVVRDDVPEMGVLFNKYQTSVIGCASPDVLAGDPAQLVNSFVKFDVGLKASGLDFDSCTSLAAASFCSILRQRETCLSLSKLETLEDLAGIAKAIATAEGIPEELRYDVIFSPEMAKTVFNLCTELGSSLDYYDPDTSYEEDAMAFSNALSEKVSELAKKHAGPVLKVCVR